MLGRLRGQNSIYRVLPSTIVSEEHLGSDQRCSATCQRLHAASVSTRRPAACLHVCAHVQSCACAPIHGLTPCSDARPSHVYPQLVLALLPVLVGCGGIRGWHAGAGGAGGEAAGGESRAWEPTTAMCMVPGRVIGERLLHHPLLGKSLRGGGGEAAEWQSHWGKASMATDTASMAPDKASLVTDASCSVADPARMPKDTASMADDADVPAPQRDGARLKGPPAAGDVAGGGTRGAARGGGGHLREGVGGGVNRNNINHPRNGPVGVAGNQD